MTRQSRDFGIIKWAGIPGFPGIKTLDTSLKDKSSLQEFRPMIQTDGISENLTEQFFLPTAIDEKASKLKPASKKLKLQILKILKP